MDGATRSFRPSLYPCIISKRRACLISTLLSVPRPERTKVSRVRKCNHTPRQHCIWPVTFTLCTQVSQDMARASEEMCRCRILSRTPSVLRIPRESYDLLSLWSSGSPRERYARDGCAMLQVCDAGAQGW